MSYLDTSVLVAYYYPESLSGKVQKVMARLTTPTISDLVELEFHSALSLKIRTGVLNPIAANHIVVEFQTHLADNRFNRVDIAAREYALARQWVGSFQSPLRTLDALHLAAAYTNDLTVYSADQHLIQSAKLFGVKHRLVS